MLIENYSKIYADKLSVLYDREEANSIKDMVFMHIFNCNRLELASRKKQEVTGTDTEILNTFLTRLLTGEPVQYVLEETYFYDLRLRVNKDVLIPRPETELLVDIFLKENQSKDLRVLDICTGSGCIPIAIKKNRMDYRVEALDISEQALAVAKLNAQDHHCQIDFHTCNIMQENCFDTQVLFDIIISNPPYVTEKEKAAMHVNVLNYEPHLALFVPDDDPLLFYKAIAKIAKQHLKKEGKMYLEINEAYGKALKDYFLKEGYTKVEIRLDQYGKERFLIVG